MVILDNEQPSKRPQAERIARALHARGCQVRIAFMRTVKDPAENIDEARAVIDDAMAGPETVLPPPDAADRRSRYDWPHTAALLDHIDLIALVEQTVPLTHSLRGDCPFHGSKGAGLGQWLTLYEGDDGIWRWHCHTGPCGGGHAADWVARRDNITSDAALDLLADTHGIPTPREAQLADRQERYDQRKGYA